MINHNNIAVRWLGLAEEIAQLAEKLPAGGDREIAEKLVAPLKSGASQESALLNRSGKEWKMPPREWSMAKIQFAVIFGER